MKKVRLLILILAVSLLFSAFAPVALAAEPPEVEAKRVVLADLNSGKLLYSKNEHEQVTPASLTKIMTLLLAVEAVENEQVRLDDMITAQEDCRIGMDEESSTSGIVPGEIMSFKDLMYCAMLQSANEACNIIATHLCGSIKDFVVLMNEKAKSLGCNETHFVNPNGLTADDHYTTAYDMYLMTAAALTHPLFEEMCNTINYETDATNKSMERKLTNSNALINMDSIYGSGYLYEYASGVKTGYTKAAGYCLVSTANKEGKHVLCVVMGSIGPLNTEWKIEDYFNFVDTIALYDWAFDSFEYKTLVSVSDVVTAVEIDMAKGNGAIELHPQSDVSVLLPIDAVNQVSLNATIDKDKLVAPVTAGDVLGTAEVFVDGQSCGTVRLVSTVTVEMDRMQYIKTKIGDTIRKPWVLAIIILLGIFILIYIILVIRYRQLRRKHLRQQRAAKKKHTAAREELSRRRDTIRRENRISGDSTQVFYTEPADRNITDTQAFKRIFSAYEKKKTVSKGKH